MKRIRHTLLFTAGLLVAGSTAFGQTICNLTTADAECANVNGAKLNQGPSPSSAGTGNLDPFYRISSNNAAVQGYNTGGSPQFDTGSSWLEALLLSTVTQIDIGGVHFREFFLDINQVKDTAPYVLDQIEIWTDTEGGLDCFNPGAGTWTPCNSGPLPVKRWSLSAPTNWDVHLNYDLESGSGVADMTLLIPDSYFGAGPECDFGQAGCTTYVYHYSSFTNNNDGFEEWATAVQPFVQVSKTIAGTANDEVNWTIEKSVDPEEWDLFTGESGTSEYKVKVTKATVAGDASIAGTITLAVPSKLPDNETNAQDAVVNNVTDVFETKSAVVVCPSPFPFTIKRNNSVQCTYTLALESKIAGTNTATAYVDDPNGGPDHPNSGTASIAAGDYATETEGDATIHVTDTNGATWEASATSEWTYSKTFTCDDDDGENSNTATIDETGQEASALVTVNCYELAVEKTAETAKATKYVWDINKVAKKDGVEVTEALMVPSGGSVVIDYEVEVSVVEMIESDWAVAGDITISNSTPLDAVLTDVSDVISPAIAGTVDCGVTFPTTLSAGASLSCSYEADLPDGTARTNTATATRQNYDYASDGTPTASGTTDVSGSADVDFSEATESVTDECVDVTDTYAGDLGEVCEEDAPKTFTYEREIEAGDETCTEFKVDNTAELTTNDTETTDSDDATVPIEVPCEGCTYTQGYWKTHNATFKGGASKKADETWCEVPDPGDPSGLCELTEFDDSGMSYFQVMWTPPSHGQVWYSLAHQYIAAWLNCNNVDDQVKVDCEAYDDVWEALASAEELLSACAPGDVAKDDPTCDSQVFHQLAGLLDNFNEGLIGPGHCDDEEPLDEQEGDGEQVAQAQKEKKVGSDHGPNNAESAGADVAEVSKPVAAAEAAPAAEVPKAFAVTNYPNPFNPQTTISIDVPELSHVSVAVYDVMGRLVAQLVNDSMPAGTHTMVWSAEHLPSGSYFLMMRAGAFVQTRQMTLLK